MRVETLETIAGELGLHPKTLYVYRDRYADFPEAVMSIGRTSGYDLEAVRAWHEKLKGGQS